MFRFVPANSEVAPTDPTDEVQHESRRPTWNQRAMIAGAISILGCLVGATWSDDLQHPVRMQWNQTYQAEQEEFIAVVGRTIIGTQQKIHCVPSSQNVDGSKGWVLRQDLTTIHLDQTVCDDLSGYAASVKASKKATDAQKLAIHVLTHESFHTTGEFNEATTECYALQRNEITATAFGANKQEARELSWWYANNVYMKLSAPYRSAECRDGGRLDINPATVGVFPPAHTPAVG